MILVLVAKDNTRHTRALTQKRLQVTTPRITVRVVLLVNQIVVWKYKEEKMCT